MRILLALPLLIAAAATPAQGYKAVKRWVAGCDNTRQCTAVGFAPEDAEGMAMLHFERGPGGNDSVQRITLRVDHPVSRENDWILQADDAELLQFNDSHLVASDSGEGNDVVITDPDEIAAMFGAMRGADTLTLVGDGGPVGTFSLSGASAILLWIDEQQQRLGTTTAFVRKGDKPASAIPAPPALPRVTPVPGGSPVDQVEAARLGKLVRETLEADVCEDLDPELPLHDSAWELPDDLTLVQLSCFAGAYNFGSRWYWLAPGAQPHSVPFPAPDEDGAMTVTGELVNASFDPATGLLDMFSKGRGIGDCGSRGLWAFDGQHFELVEYALMSDCQGVTPDFWPVLWRSVR